MPFHNEQYFSCLPQNHCLRFQTFPQETDTLTELCHVAEAIVPHPLNTEYRMKRVYLNVGGCCTEPKRIPDLNSYDFIQAAHQAQRLGVPIEQ